MSTAVIETPVAAPIVVDGLEIMRKANEAEQLRRQGKVPEPVKADEPVKPAGHEEAAKQRLSGERRKWRELYELRGRIKAYEEMGLQPKPAKAEAAKPAETVLARADFKTDEEFAAHQRRDEIRAEAGRVLAERDAAAGETQEITDIRAAMDAQNTVAKEEFADWEKVIEEGNKVALPGELHQYAPVLFISLLKSAKAAVPVYNDLIYHFAKHPDALIALMDREHSAAGMEKSKGERVVASVIEDFRELCGELRAEKRLRTKKDDGIVKSTKAPVRASADAAQAALDALKPAPSESATVKTGSSPTIEKPKAGSKEWFDLENQKEKGTGNIRLR